MQGSSPAPVAPESRVRRRAAGRAVEAELFDGIDLTGRAVLDAVRAVAAQEGVADRGYRSVFNTGAEHMLGIGAEEAQEKFGFLLDAFRFGAPPHGGIAPGIDRIVMLLCGEENLREVVLFPMNQRAEDLLMGAPSPVSEKQLRELHIQIRDRKVTSDKYK